MIKTQKITYQHDQTILEGHLAFDSNISGKCPAILVAHDWSGRNEFACQKAEKLAELGYVGFALDMYGKGIVGKDNEEKTQLIRPLRENRELLKNRILAAFEVLKTCEQVDTSKIGVIGFCFGGLCALDLARSGADINGAVSFHGLLAAPESLNKNPIKAKILVLHGHDDPMVPPEQVLAFEKEMTEADVDWQVHVYGKTMHGFTNPAAHDPGFGTVFNMAAEKRSWIAMKNFFTEVFA